MNCNEFKNYILENGIEELEGTSADEHRRVCKPCGDLYSQMASVSAMVKSLDREPAPIGFDERLRSRIAARKAADQQSGLIHQLARIRSVFDDAITRRNALAPVLAVLVLFAVLLGTNIIPLNHGSQTFQSDATDWGYIKACKNAHASISAEDPFMDRSAQLLQSSTFDADQEL